MSKELNADFWNHRWTTGQTGWDIGYASPALTQYMEQYKNKNAAILIPGCGNAHEAAFLVANGFTNITLLDISSTAVLILEEKFKDYPQIKIICEDFFQHRGAYDLIIEQTFFCAQILEKREAYVQKAASLLKPQGKLMGVLFATEFESEGPPFGGSREVYTYLFDPLFLIKIMEPCYNSIPPRMGNELFILFQKK